ncbi:serine hydrolase [Streptomyces sp. ISL-11]|uniref:serine hydrolase domain-containing protein n=1 Tax=Streptomyces sp. ISL-11 TaxID=2819174 RepID=UPI001BE53871|nr:serine hydrolase domain-containing protein [Streptomyces sp. ISL-11]MBT2386243.1 beta-lactamase family protein [Streptomyces sp. ISL-11]
MRIRTVRRTLLGALAAAVVSATALTTPASAVTGKGHDPHAATRAAMETQVKAGIPGLLGQVRDEAGTWKGSAGVADLTTNRPRLAQDRFRIGSITKAFVSVVLLQQEAEGRLSLDDTIDRWLPGVVKGHGNDGTKVTVRQLLNHTSGIYNYTDDPEFRKLLTTGFLEHRYDTFTPRRLVDVATSHDPVFRSGTSWRYSNTNYILAGMIAEKVSGRSYADEITRRVIKPLGLRTTVLPGTSARMPAPHGRAYSKLLDDPDAKIYDTTELNPSWGGAAGEIISTAGDLNTFYGALLGGELLPKAQQRELLTTVPTGGQLPGARYGLGVASITTSCGATVWMHTGGIHGSTSLATSSPDGRHTSSFNYNGDWTGDPDKLVEAEYCGTTDRPAGAGASALASLTAQR